MYNIIEAFHQLTGNAHGRQVENARRALVYGNSIISTIQFLVFMTPVIALLRLGNGGIFSASAVAILGKGKY
jgi:hypothetical protein